MQRNRLTTLAHLDSLPSLRVIDLSHNQLSDVADLTSLQHLQVLLLGSNTLSSLEQLKVRPGSERGLHSKDG
jgi:Leucine-rich repeat (LRR) protein